MWSTRTSATRRRSSVRSGWTIPPEDGAARDTQRVVQALSSSPSGPAGSVGRRAPQDGPHPFNLAPGVRGCGPAPTSAMVPFDRVFPTRSYGGLTAVPGSCAAARTRRTNFASRVSRGTSAVAHIGLAAGHHLHMLGVDHGELTAPFEDVVDGPPVDAGGLHRDVRAAGGSQPGCQPQ